MVYNGIHVAPYLVSVNVEAVRAAHGIRPGDPLVLFVGRLAIQKGVTTPILRPLVSLTTCRA